MHTEFTARVTHELKTPLTGILLMAESMQLSPQLDEETRSTFLKRIMAEGQRLSERVDEILAITREPAPHEPQQLVLHQLVRERRALPRLHGQASASRLGFRVGLGGLARWGRPGHLWTTRPMSTLWEGAWCSVRLWRVGGRPRGDGQRQRRPVERRSRSETVRGGRSRPGGSPGLGLSFVAERPPPRRKRSDGGEGGAPLGMRLPLQPSPWWSRLSLDRLEVEMDQEKRVLVIEDDATIALAAGRPERIGLCGEDGSERWDGLRQLQEDDAGWFSWTGCCRRTEISSDRQGTSHRSSC